MPDAPGAATPASAADAFDAVVQAANPAHPDHAAWVESYGGSLRSSQARRLSAASSSRPSRPEAASSAFAPSPLQRDAKLENDAGASRLVEGTPRAASEASTAAPSTPRTKRRRDKGKARAAPPPVPPPRTTSVVMGNHGAASAAAAVPSTAPPLPSPVASAAGPSSSPQLTRDSPLTQSPPQPPPPPLSPHAPGSVDEASGSPRVRNAPSIRSTRTHERNRTASSSSSSRLPKQPPVSPVRSSSANVTPLMGSVADGALPATVSPPPPPPPSPRRAHRPAPLQWLPTPPPPPPRPPRASLPSSPISSVGPSSPVAPAAGAPAMNPSPTAASSTAAGGARAVSFSEAAAREQQQQQQQQPPSALRRSIDHVFAPFGIRSRRMREQEAARQVIERMAAAKTADGRPTGILTNGQAPTLRTSTDAASMVSSVDASLRESAARREQMQGAEGLGTPGGAHSHDVGGRGSGDALNGSADATQLRARKRSNVLYPTGPSASTGGRPLSSVHDARESSNEGEGGETFVDAKSDEEGGLDDDDDDDDGDVRLTTSGGAAAAASSPSVRARKKSGAAGAGGSVRSRTRSVQEAAAARAARLAAMRSADGAPRQGDVAAGATYADAESSADELPALDHASATLNGVGGGGGPAHASHNHRRRSTSEAPSKPNHAARPSLDVGSPRRALRKARSNVGYTGEQRDGSGRRSSDAGTNSDAARLPAPLNAPSGVARVGAPTRDQAVADQHGTPVMYAASEEASAPPQRRTLGSLFARKPSDQQRRAVSAGAEASKGDSTLPAQRAASTGLGIDAASMSAAAVESPASAAAANSRTKERTTGWRLRATSFTRSSPKAAAQLASVTKTGGVEPPPMPAPPTPSAELEDAAWRDRILSQAVTMSLAMNGGAAPAWAPPTPPAASRQSVDGTLAAQQRQQQQQQHGRTGSIASTAASARSFEQQPRSPSRLFGFALRPPTRTGMASARGGGGGGGNEKDSDGEDHLGVARRPEDDDDDDDAVRGSPTIHKSLSPAMLDMAGHEADEMRSVVGSVADEEMEELEATSARNSVRVPADESPPPPSGSEGGDSRGAADEEPRPASRASTPLRSLDFGGGGGVGGNGDEGSVGGASPRSATFFRGVADRRRGGGGGGGKRFDSSSTSGTSFAAAHGYGPADRSPVMSPELSSSFDAPSMRSPTPVGGGPTSSPASPSAGGVLGSALRKVVGPKLRGALLSTSRATAGGISSEQLARSRSAGAGVDAAWASDDGLGGAARPDSLEAARAATSLLAAQSEAMPLTPSSFEGAAAAGIWGGGGAGSAEGYASSEPPPTPSLPPAGYGAQAHRGFGGGAPMRLVRTNTGGAGGTEHEGLGGATTLARGYASRSQASLPLSAQQATAPAPQVPRHAVAAAAAAAAPYQANGVRSTSYDDVRAISGVSAAWPARGRAAVADGDRSTKATATSTATMARVATSTSLSPSSSSSHSSSAAAAAAMGAMAAELSRFGEMLARAQADDAARLRDIAARARRRGEMGAEAGG